MNIFCTPNQLLGFLVYFATLFGVLWSLRNSISKKMIDVISFVIIIIYSIILLRWTATFISGFILLLFLVIVLKASLKRSNSLAILSVSFLIAYIISAVTGNACLFLPTNNGEIESYPKGMLLGFSFNQLFDNVECEVQGIGIDDRRPASGYRYSDGLFISFYSDGFSDPYTIEQVRNGEDLTYCCTKFTLINFTDTTTFWKSYAQFDVLCPVQGLFNIKGLYRTDVPKETKKIVVDAVQPIQENRNNHDIIIEKFELDQKIYSPGEKIIASFMISNTLHVPFNISVDWFHNYTRYPGWFNESTDLYNTTNEIYNYNSWYTPPSVGDWEVQLVVKYTLENKTYQKNTMSNFRVI